MKLLAQTKLTFIDILIYTCLSVMGFVRLMLNFGTIPTLPIRSNHNKEALKKAYVVGLCRGLLPCGVLVTSKVV